LDEVDVKNFNGLTQLYPTEMPYWAKNNVPIFMRATHWKTYFHFSKPKLSSKLL